LGSSRLHVVTSIVPGESACTYVSGVPQSRQNVRVTGAVEWKLAGSPFWKAKLARSKVTQATTGDAATRRHVWQWHTIVLDGVPATS
jgi:hypothetical protein